MYDNLPEKFGKMYNYFNQGLFQERQKVEIPGYIDGVKRSFFAVRQQNRLHETVATQRFNKFWANSHC